MKHPAISGWTKTSFIDYPGCPATLLFLPGCNLRCPYCHNPGIVNGTYEAIPFDVIRDHVIKRKEIIEGVVISGGEPTLHSGLTDLCGEIKSLGLKVKIDTNGLEPDVLADCRPDYLAVDIKTSLDKYNLLNIPNQYKSGCRERLSKSINIVKSMGGNAEIRITAAPGIVSRGDIECLCGELRGVGKVFIQQFNPNQPMLDPAYSSVKPYGVDELELMCSIFCDAGIKCEVR
ncbi:MAG: anaerobic ribonucleoside-triphosphate reductase activating protein [Chitinispirillales bacterium]|nr:anaerobic ribonucleoside-triphosphate reductase activating protein [Chitinispirillales bacterium]